jgi:hypothetical protein
MGNSKIIFGGEVLIDLTADTVAAAKLLKGYTAHNKAGDAITGECEFDANTSDATAAGAEILVNKTAYVNGVKVTGEMPNRGAVNGTIAAKDAAFTIDAGYHDGSGSVTIDENEKKKLIPANIREGITVLGVVGEMTGTEAALPQAKTVTPTRAQQIVTPDEGYNYLSQVTVEGIPYSESDNAAGGKTITIG